MKPEYITSKLVEKYGMKKNNCFKRRQNMSKGNIESWDKQFTISGDRNRF